MNENNQSDGQEVVINNKQIYITAQKRLTNTS